MNTRLQVEHPVTELVVEVAGAPLDLVDLQLRVAAGEELGFTQDDVRCVGHAIEARVYAEDAFGGFLPQAGTASIVRWPASARVDAALESGQTVTSAYDPMLGKVIARGSDREGARQALVAALDRTAVLGLTTNTGFLRALADSDAFRDSEVDTAWLDRHDVPPPDADTARVLAAWTDAVGHRHDRPAGPSPPTAGAWAATRRRCWSSSTASWSSTSPAARPRRGHDPCRHPALGGEPRGRARRRRPAAHRGRQRSGARRGAVLARPALRLPSRRPLRRRRRRGRATAR